MYVFAVECTQSFLYTDIASLNTCGALPALDRCLLCSQTSCGAPRSTVTSGKGPFLCNFPESIYGQLYQHFVICLHYLTQCLSTTRGGCLLRRQLLQAKVSLPAVAMAQVGTRSVPIPSSSAATGAMPGGTCSSSPEGGSFARSSGGAGMPGSLQEQLQLLKLSAQNPDTLQTLDRVMQALRGKLYKLIVQVVPSKRTLGLVLERVRRSSQNCVLFPFADVITGPGVLASSMSEEEEARWWSCFADVFEKEVSIWALRAADSSPAPHNCLWHCMKG